jgi:hypothetical protein
LADIVSILRSQLRALRRRCAVTLALGACGSVVALAAEPPIQHGLRSPVVVSDDTGRAPRLTLGNGRTVSLEADSSFEPHDLAVEGETWLVAGSRRGLDRREHLALVAGAGERQRELPVPGGQTARARTAPVLLGADRLLAGTGGGGLAWLEGGSAAAFAVWAADWNGDGFDAPVVVSPRGKGSQTGLAGSELADGSRLLVWSAFDGADDEIVWSVHDGESWSEPLALTRDGEPDITPALLRTEDGALLVWSSYEGGQYRLALAAYGDGAWSPPALAGPASALYPQFVRGAPEPTLSFLEATPRRWAVAAVSPAERRLVARAGVASSAERRPVVSAAGGGRVRFHFEGAAQGDRAGSSIVAAWEPEP